MSATAACIVGLRVTDPKAIAALQGRGEPPGITQLKCGQQLFVCSMGVSVSGCGAERMFRSNYPVLENTAFLRERVFNFVGEQWWNEREFGVWCVLMNAE